MGNFTLHVVEAEGKSHCFMVKTTEKKPMFNHFRSQIPLFLVKSPDFSQENFDSSQEKSQFSESNFGWNPPLLNSSNPGTPTRCGARPAAWPWENHRPQKVKISWWFHQQNWWLGWQKKQYKWWFHPEKIGISGDFSASRIGIQPSEIRFLFRSRFRTQRWDVLLRPMHLKNDNAHKKRTSGSPMFAASNRDFFLLKKRIKSSSS